MTNKTRERDKTTLLRMHKHRVLISKHVTKTLTNNMLMKFLWTMEVQLHPTTWRKRRMANLCQLTIQITLPTSRNM